MAKRATKTTRRKPATPETPVGPRGGTTTTTAAGKRRAEIYFSPEVWQAIRSAAFERETSHSAIVEECCGKVLHVGEKG